MPEYKYPRPAVTVDVVLLRPGTGPTQGRLEILLIRRKVDPFAGHWALPGGFLDMDEELETAARRELLEETGVRVGRLLPLQVYAKVGRDPWTSGADEWSQAPTFRFMLHDGFVRDSRRTSGAKDEWSQAPTFRFMLHDGFVRDSSGAF